MNFTSISTKKLLLLKPHSLNVTKRKIRTLIYVISQMLYIDASNDQFIKEVQLINESVEIIKQNTLEIVVKWNSSALVEIETAVKQELEKLEREIRRVDYDNIFKKIDEFNRDSRKKVKREEDTLAAKKQDIEEVLEIIIGGALKSLLNELSEMKDENIQYPPDGMGKKLSTAASNIQKQAKILVSIEGRNNNQVIEIPPEEDRDDRSRETKLIIKTRIVVSVVIVLFLLLLMKRAFFS